MTKDKNNTGDCNTGDWNTGDCNTGDWNTGNRNTGNCNTGHWNTCNSETGFFNTTQPDTVRVFNKNCSVEDWKKAKKPDLLYFSLTEWICDKDMTDQEKIDNPTFHTTGGYLRKYDYKEAFQRSWEKASAEDRQMVKDLPNFDADIFYEISGIRVDAPVTCAGKIVEIDGKKYKLTEV